MLVLRSKIALASDAMTENHYNHAESFLRGGSNTEEFLTHQQQVAKIAICIGVIDDLREEVGGRISDKRPPFEIVVGTEFL